MAAQTEKLPVREKVGYALGDTAANFIFQTMVLFQLAFYTDTFGIAAAAAGTLLLVARVWDAFFDPIMGVIADRTDTRWGKFRPWVLWTAPFFGLMGFLTFLTPDFSPGGKLVYAYVVYIVLMTVYSANNLPYSALSGVMTGDLDERTNVSQYRFVFAMLGQLIINSLALPMVLYFGHGNNALGYKITMGIFSALAVVLFIITFASTKERVRPPREQNASVAQHFRDLTGNKPWLAMFALTFVIFITHALRGSDVLYYFTYYVRRQDLFTWFTVTGTIANIVGIVFSRRLAVHFGKRDVFIGGVFGTALFNASFILLPPSAIPLMFAAETLRQLVYGFTIPLLWAMMADVADFSEWKNHRRATGIVFAAIVFALKAGLGLGGAITGWLLASYGYVPNAAQGARALSGIKLIMSVYPALLLVLCGVILFFYRIDRQGELRITEELAARRRAGEAVLQPVP